MNDEMHRYLRSAKHDNFKRNFFNKNEILKDLHLFRFNVHSQIWALNVEFDLSCQVCVCVWSPTANLTNQTKMYGFHTEKLSSSHVWDAIAS